MARSVINGRSGPRSPINLGERSAVDNADSQQEKLAAKMHALSYAEVRKGRKIGEGKQVIGSRQKNAKSVARSRRSERKY